ncbi:MmgE/PrpD family protein [Pelagibius sp. Alg239-R121]|uniref:MmgE/PrpD family protein n=1 Tax=Pelagibius sp. Alg239-R121 TaxID=2993448 RepID=UPI0024A64232|nr:MmgE/PrpD family protein [Pelagibius sp. Alg239-R121]
MTTSKAQLIELPGVTEAITGFVAGMHSNDIPESARRIARLSLLDWMAVAIAGRNEPVSRIVRELVAEEDGRPDASVFGHPVKLPARAAALANGAISHALDYDDTHFLYLGHPSAAVLPAALAVAEKNRVNPKDFLDAALIGFEVACRVGAWLGRRHYQIGFHQTATAGSFGAAMAAARLLKLDKEMTGYALGLAATRASGLKAQFGTMGKPYHAGMAASNGVEAALLAARGFVARPDGLECAQGFAETHAGVASDPSLILDGLGQHFVFEDVQHKFHACCHGTHAALEALIELRDSHRLDANDIASVTITVHPRYLKVCNISEPQTALQAKFSYRLTAALVLAGHDTAALTTFSDANCRDRELTVLRDRVTVTTDADMTETAATVGLEHLSDGAINGYHDLAAPRSNAVRETRVRDKAASLLGRQSADALWDEINGSNGLLEEWIRRT